MKHYLTLLSLLILFSCEKPQLTIELPEPDENAPILTNPDNRIQTPSPKIGPSRLWIWDDPGSTHALTIISTFKAQYGAIDDERIIQVKNIPIDELRIGDIVIRSFRNARYHINKYGRKITEIGALFCLPLGSNSNIELKGINGKDGITLSGAGDNCINFTAYGRALQFVENAGASSFSNAIVAAKFLQVYEATLVEDWQTIIKAAEATGKPWTPENGVGCIDVDETINYLL